MEILYTYKEILNMGNFKVKTQVRSEESVKLIKGKLFKDIKRLSKAEGIGADFTDSTMPSASGLDDGIMAYNADQEEIKVTASGAWA